MCVEEEVMAVVVDVVDGITALQQSPTIVSLHSGVPDKNEGCISFKNPIMKLPDEILPHESQ